VLPPPQSVSELHAKRSAGGSQGDYEERGLNQCDVSGRRLESQKISKPFLFSGLHGDRLIYSVSKQLIKTVRHCAFDTESPSSMLRNDIGVRDRYLIVGLHDGIDVKAWNGAIGIEDGARHSVWTVGIRLDL
jgi:hypothetical protein